MPTGPKGEKRFACVIDNAIKVATIATGEGEDCEAAPEKEEAVAAMGRMGGTARAAKMPLISGPLGPVSSLA